MKLNRLQGVMVTWARTPVPAARWWQSCESSQPRRCRALYQSAWLLINYKPKEIPLTKTLWAREGSLERETDIPPWGRSITCGWGQLHWHVYSRCFKEPIDETVISCRWIDCEQTEGEGYQSGTSVLPSFIPPVLTECLPCCRAQDSRVSKIDEHAF